MKTPLQVMVVDDSLTYRSILKGIIDAIADIELVATAANGKIALAKMAEASPDLVLLDVTMPVMDGLAALKRIRADYPDVQVVMVSGFQRENADIVMECLAAGALEFVTKPESTQGPEYARNELRRALMPILNIVIAKLLVRGRRHETPPTRSEGKQEAIPARQAPRAESPVASPPVSVLRSADLVLIGSSTGGPMALARILKDMGADFPVPILMVQHMPPLFTASLASQLQRSTGLAVREAEDGDALAAGTVLLAPGGRHMTLDNIGGRQSITLTDDAKVNGCRPAVDVLFTSVAERFTGGVLSIVLTGMGQDGANGVAALKQRGSCACIVQDEETCVVYGMPRAVNERRLADEVLPLAAIGPRIRQLCG